MELSGHIPANIMSFSVTALKSTLARKPCGDFTSVRCLAFWCKIAGQTHQQEAVSSLLWRQLFRSL